MTRIGRFQSQLKPNEAILLSSATDVAYFTHFEFLVPEEREAFVIFTPSKTYLVVSLFSPVPESSELTILRGCQPTTLARHLQQVSAEQNIMSLFYQGHSLFVDELDAVKKLLPKINYFPLSPRTVWKQRMIKDDLEITHLKNAAEIVSKTLAKINSFFEVGITELELTAQIEKLFTEYGADDVGFPTIVAFGDHSTSPHHQPGNTPLTENTAILIDCGAKVNGYRSDMTRTWWFGKKPSETFAEIENIVKAAYQLSFNQALVHSKKSVTAKELDELARQYITDSGYGKEFIHTTGHGVGLDIHEPPSLSWSDETVLLTGMVITIEPGIYLDGKFGYRYENTVLITDAGAVELTNDDQTSH